VGSGVKPVQTNFKEELERLRDKELSLRFALLPA
jgi:hypothetical protein